MRIPIFLKEFSSFVKIYEAGARPKHRYRRNWYRVPSHRNITLFRSSWESGTYKYASLGSSLHMYSFFCKGVSILKCRKGMYWFNSFKLTTGLLPPSLFFAINMLVRNRYFCGQTCSAAPFFKRFFTSNEIFSFFCLKSLFPLVPSFVLVCKRMEFDILWLSGKYSHLFSVFPSCLGRELTSLPVTLLESLKSRTVFIPIDVLMTTLLVVLVVEFLWRRLLFWFPEFLNCPLL